MVKSSFSFSSDPRAVEDLAEVDLAEHRDALMRVKLATLSIKPEDVDAIFAQLMLLVDDVRPAWLCEMSNYTGGEFAPQQLIDVILADGRLVAYKFGFFDDTDGTVQPIDDTDKNVFDTSDGINSRGPNKLLCLVTTAKRADWVEYHLCRMLAYGPHNPTSAQILGEVLGYPAHQNFVSAGRRYCFDWSICSGTKSVQLFANVFTSRALLKDCHDLSVKVQRSLARRGIAAFCEWSLLDS